MESSAIEIMLQRDCLGGERVVELVLPQPVHERALDRIPAAGKRQILRQLPRPFFRLDVPGQFLLSGILGDPKVRFTVRLAMRDRALEISLRAAERLMDPSP